MKKTTNKETTFTYLNETDYLVGDMVKVKSHRYGFDEREKWDGKTPDPLVGTIIGKDPKGLFCTVQLPHAIVSPFYYQVERYIL